MRKNKNSIQVYVFYRTIDDYFSIKKGLEKCGGIVRYCINGTDKIRVASDRMVKNIYDIYFVDMDVDPPDTLPNPPKSGIEILDRVIAGGCFSPIIIYSLVHNIVYEQQSYDHGAAGYINIEEHFNKTCLSLSVKCAMQYYERLHSIQQQQSILQKQFAEINRQIKRVR